MTEMRKWLESKNGWSECWEAPLNPSENPVRRAEMTEPEALSPVQESRYHNYLGNSIPWYVRVLWLCFWVGAISYVFSYLLPALQSELVSPP